ALPLLVELGARVDADPYRGTALAWAAAQGRVAAVRKLVELGADPNQRGTFGGPTHGEGVTAINLAAQSGERETVYVLLELGAGEALLERMGSGSDDGLPIQARDRATRAALDAREAKAPAERGGRLLWPCAGEDERLALVREQSVDAACELEDPVRARSPDQL